MRFTFTVSGSFTAPDEVVATDTDDELAAALAAIVSDELSGEVSDLIVTARVQRD